MSFEFTGIVKVVEVKKAKNNKTYYRLNIPQGGSDRWHSSFDSKVVELQGETVNFNAVKTDYGWNLKDYEIAAAQESAPQQARNEGKSGRSDHENVWIAAQGLVFRGVEVGFFQGMTHALEWFNKTIPVLEAIWNRDEETVKNLLNELELAEIGEPEEPPEEEELK